MIQSQKGDQGAYRALLLALVRPIETYVKKRVGFLGIHDDILQEVLIGIDHAKQTYSPEQPFSPWFYSIVRYKMIDAIRRNKRVQSHELASLDSINFSTTPDSKTDLYEVKHLHAAIQNLKEVYRRPLVLVKLEEKTIAETALILGISESNVKVRIHRGLMELKKAFLKQVEKDENF